MNKRQFENGKVTVVIPVYNEEQFLRQALESVVEQVDCVVISDNASTDGTKAICHEFAEKYSHVIYFSNEKNLGSIENYKHCYQHVKTEFVFHMGGHDLVPPNYVTTLKEMLNHHQESLCAFAPCRFFDNNPESPVSIRDFRDFKKEIQNNNPFVRAAHYVSTKLPANVFFGLYRSAIFCDEMQKLQTFALQPIAAFDQYLIFIMLLHGKMTFSSETYFLRRDVHREHNVSSTKDWAAYVKRMIGDTISIVPKIDYSTMVAIMLERYDQTIADRDFQKNKEKLRKNMQHQFCKVWGQLGCGGTGVPQYKRTKFHYNRYRLLSNVTFGTLREKYNVKKRTLKGLLLMQKQNQITSKQKNLRKFWREIKRLFRQTKQLFVNDGSSNPFKIIPTKGHDGWNKYLDDDRLYSPCLNDEDKKAVFKKYVECIGIEVFSFCNRRCWFCPNSYIDRHSSNTFMDKGLYGKILDELAEIDYSGRISYSRYNEPFADRIILERIHEAKAKLPQATLFSYTNGDYITREFLDEIAEAGLSKLFIMCYPRDGHYSQDEAAQDVTKVVQRLGYPAREESHGKTLTQFKVLHPKMKVFITRRDTRQYTSRAGAVNWTNKIVQTHTRRSHCLYPFLYMPVDHDGSVMPCCHTRSDVPQHRDIIMGNIRKNSLWDIYTCTSLSLLRYQLRDDGVKISPCSNCDDYGYTMSQCQWQPKTQTCDSRDAA